MVHAAETSPTAQLEAEIARLIHELRIVRRVAIAATQLVEFPEVGTVVRLAEALSVIEGTAGEAICGGRTIFRHEGAAEAPAAESFMCLADLDRSIAAGSFCRVTGPTFDPTHPNSPSRA